MEAIEKEVVDKLMLMADGTKDTKEFQGFDEAEAATLLKSPPREDSRVLEPKSPAMLKSEPLVVKTAATFLKEGDIKNVVEQVISQLTPVIKSLCVTERLLQTQVGCE